MSGQGEPIKPKAVPLTHAGPVRKSRKFEWRRLAVYLFLAAAGTLVFVLFVLAPEFVTPISSDSRSDEDTSVATDAGRPVDRPAPVIRPAEPPPFEALRRQQARTGAQDELARFVELEIELREAMQVETWGAEAYDNAKALAHEGDESFVQERYDDAISNYRAAADELEALIGAGHSRFEAALAAALEAIDARDSKQAEKSLSEARLVKPAHPSLMRAASRAKQLPEIIVLFRKAHNQELAGRWDDALRTYSSIRALDPDTPGMNRAVAAARQQRSAQRLQSLLSAGFAQLAKGQLSAAESSFNQALAMDPQNGAALGGLQQIDEQGLVREVERLRGLAADAGVREDWPTAIQSFRQILSIDANIQFARSGLAEAQRQSEILAALNEVSAEAASLSSDRRYAAAKATLSDAMELEPRGPKLAEKIDEVDVLLTVYAHPVPVVFRSDNATEILLSNVGPLGKFSEKRLSLRPGAYTLIGSRDGCRDVRTTITVRTDMAPVDIRCQEVLAR